MSAFFFFLDTSLKLNISTPSLDLRSGQEGKIPQGGGGRQVVYYRGVDRYVAGNGSIIISPKGRTESG